MEKKRLDLRIEDEQTLKSLELCLELTRQTSYSGAIRDIINNYPRMVEVLEKTKIQLKQTENKTNELSNNVSDFINALEKLKNI